jgi:PhzF family phenazine biosynthesis protein
VAPTIEILRLAAFTSDPAGGNPGGVAIVEAMPDASEMQRLAAEVGYSETGYFMPQGPAGEGVRAVDVRFFSPAAEVDFCGHVTIAGAVALAERYGPGRFALSTTAGPVEVETMRRADGLVDATLTSVAPRVVALPDALLEVLLEALRMPPGALDQMLPTAIGYAGVWHPIVPLRDRATLAGLDYDYEALRTIMVRERWTTIQVVWRESAERWHARDPFAFGGVVEDPATGAAAAALGAYTRRFGLVQPPAELIVIQGEDMGRPSTIRVEVTPGDAGIRVSGTAVPIPT